MYRPTTLPHPVSCSLVYLSSTRSFPSNPFTFQSHFQHFRCSGAVLTSLCCLMNTVHFGSGIGICLSTHYPFQVPFCHMWALSLVRLARGEASVHCRRNNIHSSNKMRLQHMSRPLIVWPQMTDGPLRPGNPTLTYVCQTRRANTVR